MIILPGAEPRGRILLPQRPGEWRQPSVRRTARGAEDRTRFRLTARLHDGCIVWRGWFDDRVDADEFLWALATGSLRRERELWRLPTPAWHPDLGASLVYDFATVTFLTSGAGSNQSYSVPSDWSRTNSVECIGGGGGGANMDGGGGGGYSKIESLTLTPGALVTYQIGAGGPGAAAGLVTALQNGSPGGDTWFNGASFAASSVGAKGGSGGVSHTEVLGGQASDGVGTTKCSGGGNTRGTGRGGSGGGGAAGPNGNGLNGAAEIDNNLGAAGGTGDAGIGGAGGAGNTAGSSGTNAWVSDPGGVTAGAGGGGGGGNGSSGLTTGKAGGSYGAGGGGGGFNNFSSQVSAGGAGAQGIIVVTYTPARAPFPLHRSTRFFKQRF